MSSSRLVGLAILILVSIVAAGVAVGQTSGNVRRVGVIYLSGTHREVVEGMRQGLRELGLEEGKSVALDVREIKGDVKVVGQTAADLERGKVDLIYAVTTPVAVAAKASTAHTPIVFFVGTDSVAVGLVESLAKPGGRLTGIHGLSRDLTAKRLEILKEMIPRVRRVVTFYNPDVQLVTENVQRDREAARKLGVQLVERPVRSVEELRQALQQLKPGEVDAYFHTPDAMVTSQAQLIIDTARAKKLPTMFHEQNLGSKGALASYGSSYLEIGRLTAKHVQRILAGTPPRDLPVENYDKVEFVLNLRTAREIGFTVPAAVRIRADTVIE